MRRLRVPALGRLTLVLSGVLLAACVLHSQHPLFDEAQAVPLFGSQPVTFAVYDLNSGAWVASAEPLATLTPVGRHYEMPDPSTEDPAKVDSYSFIPLDSTHFVVQVVAGGEADYGLATWDGQVLLASPLDCDALQARTGTAGLIAFDKDGCAPITGTGPALALFVGLAAEAGAPTLRFVRQ